MRKDLNRFDTDFSKTVFPRTGDCFPTVTVPSLVGSSGRTSLILLEHSPVLVFQASNNSPSNINSDATQQVSPFSLSYFTYTQV